MEQPGDHYVSRAISFEIVDEEFAERVWMMCAPLRVILRMEPMAGVLVLAARGAIRRHQG